MDMGGRLAVYDLMDMEAPAIAPRPKPKSAPKLEIDRTGSSDPARYTGLKMGQVMDDSVMADALQRAQEKSKKGEALRPKLQEEEFEKPFEGTCMQAWRRWMNGRRRSQRLVASRNGCLTR